MLKPYYETPNGIIYQGNALDILKQLPSESVHLIVTSPPYWKLRSYLPNDHPDKRDEIGQEKTPEEYVEKLVEIFREARRILRNDGIFYLNIGDSYAQSGGSGSGEYQKRHKQFGKIINSGTAQESRNAPEGFKPKDLCAIPWMLAIALREDGWYLRSGLPWINRSRLPESVKDRFTSSLEYVFLLSKSEKYYFDMNAIRKENSIESKRRAMRGVSKDNKYAKGSERPVGVHPNTMSQYREYRGYENMEDEIKSGNTTLHPDGRNFRNTDLFLESLTPPFGTIFADEELVGIDVTSTGTRFKHFASFPTRIPEIAILSGTSEKGCCSVCGSSWERITEKISSTRTRKVGIGQDTLEGRKGIAGSVVIETLGWQPTCKCKLYKLKDNIPHFSNGGTNKEMEKLFKKEEIPYELLEYFEEVIPPVEPCVVCDIFGGTMTSAIVASNLNRKFIMIELSENYIKDIGIPLLNRGGRLFDMKDYSVKQITSILENKK